MSAIKYHCPCCGCLTLSQAERGSYEICPVCYWEDDAIQFEHTDFSGGANRVSLEEARRNYAAFGASEEEFRAMVRAPLPEELPTKQ